MRKRRTDVSAALLIGAAAIAVLRALLGVPFDATPLLVGLVALLAAAVQTEPRPWTPGLVLVVWGAAVLLVRQGPLPSREAPVFLVAAGLGLLLARAVSPSAKQGEALRSAALTLTAGGALFYLVFDLPWLTQWWVFPAGLTLAALVEAGRGGR